MASYTLKVTTGDMKHAGTTDHIYVILFGTEGQSKRTKLGHMGIDFKTGKMGTYPVKTNSSLGKLLLVKVEKDPRLGLPEDEWYCSKIVVTTPEGEDIVFPCYRWISRGQKVELRGGRAMKIFEDEHPLLIEHRKEELKLRKSLFQWEIGDDKLLNISTFKNVSELPEEIRFSESKAEEMSYMKKMMGFELLLKGLAGSKKQWKNTEDMKQIFKYKKTSMSKYVSEHWKEDDFFGSQFLNATNPNVIKLCTKLPPNFPVTEGMVKDFLPAGSTLKNEMEKGNVFLVDQKIMDGIPTRSVDGNALFISSGFCLFYMNPEKKLMPLAIQLHQQPSEQNPIFLPSDLQTDWLLARLFFNSADLMEYQTVYHLMNTHYLAEVFTLATLRCLPAIHPLYKLLIPHFRYTLHINILARLLLLGPGGAMSSSSLGVDGLMELMRRNQSRLTYSSLCLPENITARGLDSIPNFYYRDDGLKLWGYISSYVRSMVVYYYPSDSHVCKDTELQEWIQEIFTHGFLENKHAGFPASFSTTAEMINFITMVIFTVSVQHAAVNNGQFDYHSWIPNGALLLCKPPPTSKGQSSMKGFLEVLPNIGQSVKFIASAFVLSDKYKDTVRLGEFPEELFNEPTPLQVIKEFQDKLSYLREEIKTRNSPLQIPYMYLDPDQIENSVSI